MKDNEILIYKVNMRSENIRIMKSKDISPETKLLKEILKKDFKKW
ncbi:hypothetical protein [Bacillus phage vB_BanS-Thrax5]|nr:hypothetical protein [Bacillus phage vB_BanS-Thrax5]